MAHRGRHGTVIAEVPEGPHRRQVGGGVHHDLERHVRLERAVEVVAKLGGAHVLAQRREQPCGRPLRHAALEAARPEVCPHTGAVQAREKSRCRADRQRDSALAEQAHHTDLRAGHVRERREGCPSRRRRCRGRPDAKRYCGRSQQRMKHVMYTCRWPVVQLGGA
eukprot:scaffold23711_cov133-Isochrysis_galbana.AAC.3